MAPRGRRRLQPLQRFERHLLKSSQTNRRPGRSPAAPWPFPFQPPARQAPHPKPNARAPHSLSAHPDASSASESACRGGSGWAPSGRGFAFHRRRGECHVEDQRDTSRSLLQHASPSNPTEPPRRLPRKRERVLGWIWVGVQWTRALPFTAGVVNATSRIKETPRGPLCSTPPRPTPPPP